MASYKRNQIEEAISRVFAPNFERPGAELRARIKRLLELDRALGRKPRSQDEEEANFAFFSDEAPGTGSEIWFSDYEAFALLSGLRIMEHGWPQGFAVSVMRRLRPDLEKQHGCILKQNPNKLFDWQLISGKRTTRRHRSRQYSSSVHCVDLQNVAPVRGSSHPPRMCGVRWNTGSWGIH